MRSYTHQRYRKHTKFLLANHWIWHTRALDACVGHIAASAGLVQSPQLRAVVIARPIAVGMASRLAPSTAKGGTSTHLRTKPVITRAALIT